MAHFSSNPYNLKPGDISSGTTIMAVKFDGGVILGADSRTSSGTYVANRVSDKIVPLHDTIWTCRSGSAADTQTIADYVRYYISGHATELGRKPRVKTAANLISKIIYNNKDRMQAGMICAGYDPYSGGQVFEVPLGGTLMEADFSIGGSGSAFIYGLVDSLYKPNMSRDECKAFVTKCVSHAMSRDGSSGGVVRLVVIDKDGVEKCVIMGDDLPQQPCVP